MSGRLITDLDLLAGRVTSPIVLGPGDLITPAARDRALANGMVVVERDGSVSGAAAGLATSGPRACGCGAAPGGANWPEAGSDTPDPCACGGGCGARRLPDGLHLVRVDQGRIQWTRPLAGEAPARPGGRRARSARPRRG